MTSEVSGATSPSIDEQLAESWLATLESNASFDAPWVQEAVAWLADDGRPGSVLDVGCGAGGAAAAFARALPAATVVATDRDPRLLAVARGRAAAGGVADRIRWLATTIDALALPDRSVELAWASGVVHHTADQQATVYALARLVRPGGRLVLVEGGLPLRCLPHEIGLGRPGLESRLDEARSRWFVDMRAELGGPPLPYGWPETLARAGLAGVRSRSFLAELVPPLGELGRQIVEQHLTSALTDLEHRLDKDDRATLARLLDPDDTAYMGRRDDLVVTAARTVHVGTAPGAPLS
ncbi:MAG TPA: methyltransferase domain-containing protein [Acidimicrobiales bacterium]|nr:methyltransferase domain-containing protein [Acidimicrobiales bacterium]